MLGSCGTSISNIILSGFNGFITIIFPMSIWDALYKWTSSPFWKSIISLKDQFVATCGSHHRAIALMSTWSGGELSFTAQSYDFLHFKCDPVPWAKLVWESWSIPRYNFILWPAVLGKLRTRDRLQFLQINPLCVFYWVDEESHNHVFFSFPWPLFFLGWKNLGFICIEEYRPLIVQFVVFFLAGTILIAECEEFPLVFIFIWFGKREIRESLITLAI